MIGTSPRLLPGAVLLDMDDTILADSRDTDRCWREACVAHSHRFGGASPVEVHSAIDAYRTWYWSEPDRHRDGRLDLVSSRRHIVEVALQGLGIADRTLAFELADEHSRLRELHMEPLPGALEMIERLRSFAVRLALITNGAAEPQRRKIERFGLAPRFDCVVVEGEFGFGKPHESTYRHALAQLGVHPRNAWMAGDNLEWDVGAPQRLGITGIWIDAAGKGRPPDSDVRPDRIITSLAELL